jgi:signal peptidase I
MPWRGKLRAVSRLPALPPAVDFALLLVVATAVSGLIWAVDAAFLRPRRVAVGAGRVTATGEPFQPAEPVLVEYARSFFPILLVVLLIRSFLFEPFRIPSASMVPTLLIGDFIFVNKFTYGLRLPVLNNRIVELGAPARGDVVVFRLPADPSTNYIKRLVGLPGDEVVYLNSRLYINGTAVPVAIEGPWSGDGSDAQPPSILGRETLGESDHDVLFIPSRPSFEGTFIVPPGHYFLMGDNRDNSQDSRYDLVGMVPEDNIVGKAVGIWMNWDFSSAPRLGRIGMAIR